MGRNLPGGRIWSGAANSDIGDWVPASPTNRPFRGSNLFPESRRPFIYLHQTTAFEQSIARIERPNCWERGLVQAAGGS
jgi:hypothetical protein